MKTIKSIDFSKISKKGTTIIGIGYIKSVEDESKEEFDFSYDTSNGCVVAYVDPEEYDFETITNSVVASFQ